MLARIIEPTSKQDSLRVRSEAGVEPVSYRTGSKRRSFLLGTRTATTVTSADGWPCQPWPATAAEKAVASPKLSGATKSVNATWRPRPARWPG